MIFFFFLKRAVENFCEFDLESSRGCRFVGHHWDGNFVVFKKILSFFGGHDKGVAVQNGLGSRLTDLIPFRSMC